MLRALLFILLMLPLPAYAAKLKVVASFSIIADLAAQVAGDAAEVTPLVAAGGDAHVYEPSPADTRRLTHADLVLINGLGFEGWQQRLVEASGSKAPVITVTKGITPLTRTDGETDPHAWQDIANAKIYVANIRDALLQTDPSHAEQYKNNAANYLEQLTSLEQWVKQSISEIPQQKRRAITSHDALGYFSRAYGIELIAAQGLSTEGELSAHGLAKIIDQIRAQQVKAVFLENMANPRLIRQLAEESGAIIGGTLYSDALSEPSEDGATYLSMFRHNVTVLTNTLKK